MELVLCAGVGFINYYLPSAYMDEIFHERQTNAYYEFKYDHWDPKLTTFPGLFFITSMLRNAVYISGLSVPVQQYRAFNVFYSCCLYWLLKRGEAGARRAAYLLSFPPLFMCCFLYYTDVIALLSIIWVYYLVRERHYALSGVFGALAVICR
jgi:alpha-1,2-glucosyltransferase